MTRKVAKRLDFNAAASDVARAIKAQRRARTISGCDRAQTRVVRGLAKIRDMCEELADLTVEVTATKGKR